MPLKYDLPRDSGWFRTYWTVTYTVRRKSWRERFADWLGARLPDWARISLLDCWAASVDTHPKGGDAKQAPCASMGSAVGSEADETPNLDSPSGDKQ